MVRAHQGRQVIFLAFGGFSGTLRSLGFGRHTDHCFSRSHEGEHAAQRPAELLAHALGFKDRTFQHLQTRYQAKVERLVAPLMAELLPQLSRKIVSLSHDEVA